MVYSRRCKYFYSRVVLLHCQFMRVQLFSVWFLSLLTSQWGLASQRLGFENEIFLYTASCSASKLTSCSWKGRYPALWQYTRSLQFDTLTLISWCEKQSSFYLWQELYNLPFAPTLQFFVLGAVIPHSFYLALKAKVWKGSCKYFKYLL